ncbi:uncharacterized protein LOC143627705 [Bidens hawaiensis]|uniref:uncharacterized protein LOC143627705 n=1 Tax=Bidens hawaiensis TaxID=980011 RepID=UPI00404A62E3
MTGQKALFEDINMSKKVKVRMGNGKKIQVEGKGVVKIDAMTGKNKTIRDVQYAPELDYDLLSVGQLMTVGHKLLLDGGMCTITNKQTNKVVCKIPMSSNNTFPLNVGRTCEVGLSAMSEETLTWHLRYGHLNEGSLHTLSSKEMVYGLPKVKHWNVCEGCV